MSHGKFGRRPFVPSDRTIKSGEIIARALAPLGPPPPVSTDWSIPVIAQSPGGWQILGNDSYGDCVEAAEGHHLMQRTANTGRIVIPTTDQILALYSAETGFNPSDPNTDQGTSMAEDASFMCSTGLLGHVADTTAWVDPTNIPNLQWCIQLLGGIGIGVGLPNSALNQFNSGQPWTVLENDGGLAGGHDLFLSHYDGTWIYGVTWAQQVLVAPAWIIKYADEAHGLVFLDWIQSTGSSPAGFNLAQTVADLQAIQQLMSGTHSHRWHIKRRRRIRRNAGVSV